MLCMEDMHMSETWVPREELEGLIGREGAALLCREAGGVPIYVPVKTNPACRLGRILPARPLAALVAAYGGTMITVPNGKFRPHKDVILRRLEQGEPHARIALDVGVTERYVRQLASRKARNRQLSFF